MKTQGDKSFNESDEHVSKPTCPYCKSYVNENIIAIN